MVLSRTNLFSMLPISHPSIFFIYSFMNAPSSLWSCKVVLHTDNYFLCSNQLIQCKNDSCFIHYEISELYQTFNHNL